MSTINLYQLSVAEALTKLKAKEISAVQLTQSILTHANQLEETLHAYITLQPDLALEMAQAADDRRAAGEDSLLLGIPIGIKDSISTQGLKTTCGSKILADYIPPYDATVVQKLRQAGAVFLGKTNTDEFTMGSSTEHAAFFPTRNPWDIERVPGGSSGGSAAAVTAMTAPVALGTDTGGSIRQPAAFCGITGLKPTYGRVSRYGLIAHGSSLDQIGPLSRSARDAALVLQTIAGHDPKDATTLKAPVPDYSRDLEQTQGFKGLKIGLPREYFIDGLNPVIETAVRQALKVAEANGAEIIDISLPHTPYGIPVYYLIATAEASSNLSRYDGVRYGLRVPGEDMWQTFFESRAAGFGPEVKRRIMLGTYALSAGYYDAYYLKAQKVRTLLRRDFEAAFQKVDVIFTPVTPDVAFKLGQKVDDPLQMYLSDIFTVVANLAGICGITVGCGFSEGLPLGLQILGPALDESTILQVAHAYQRETDWHTRRPELKVG